MFYNSHTYPEKVSSFFVLDTDVNPSARWRGIDRMTPERDGLRRTAGENGRSSNRGHSRAISLDSTTSSRSNGWMPATPPQEVDVPVVHVNADDEMSPFPYCFVPFCAQLSDGMAFSDPLPLTVSDIFSSLPIWRHNAR
jgi:hypothetical protein